MKRAKHPRRWIAWVAAVLVVVGGVAYWRMHRPVVPQASAATAQYSVAVAQSGAFTGQVSGSGNIEPEATATMQAPADGTLARLSATLGSEVTVGETLASLSGGQTITSPISGTVVSVPALSGAYVTAGETIVTVADLSTIYASIEIPEQSIRYVAAGQEATVTVPALPDKTFLGTVSEVGREGTSSGGIVDYPVLVKIAAPTGLLAGMSADATLTTGSVSQAVWVPTAAVQVVNGQTVVIEPKSAISLGYGGNGRMGFGGGGFGGGQGGGGASGDPPSFAGGSSGGSRGTGLLQATIPVTVTVRIGLTNSTDTQILSGVGAGQQVLIQDAQASSGAFSGGGGFRFRMGAGI